MKRYKYKIIEYKYTHEGVRICKCIHLFDSKLKYYLLLLKFKLLKIEYAAL